jgi:hypothetical protein
VRNANSGNDKNNNLEDASSVTSFSVATGTLSEATEVVFGTWTWSGSSLSSYTNATGWTNAAALKADFIHLLKIIPQ